MAGIDTAGGCKPGFPGMGPFDIESMTVEVYRAPIARPVRTAFGTMTDRPAVVVRVRSTDGTLGYGEAWCNFPAPAAEHRARLISSVLAPEVVGRPWPNPKVVFDHLSATTRRLALQSGEPGPFAQAIAGVDIALWDMVARRAGQPLWRLLGREGDGRLPVYASGIGPDGASTQALEARAAGHRAFKLKIGFDERADLADPSGPCVANSARTRSSPSMPTKPGHPTRPAIEAGHWCPTPPPGWRSRLRPTARPRTGYGWRRYRPSPWTPGRTSTANRPSIG